jgi:hypothetical protein
MDRPRLLGALSVALLGAALACHVVADGYICFAAAFGEPDFTLDSREAHLSQVPDSPAVRQELAQIRETRWRERLWNLEGALAAIAICGQVLALVFAAVGLNGRRRRLVRAAVPIAALPAVRPVMSVLARLEAKRWLFTASWLGVALSLSALALLWLWLRAWPSTIPDPVEGH